MVIAVRLCLAFLLSMAPALAQTFPAIQKEMVWDGSRVAVVESGNPPYLELETPSAKRAQTLKGPAGTTSLHFWNGKAWATTRTTENEQRKTVLFGSVNFTTWSREATCEADEGMPLALYPLQNGTFLGFAADRGFAQNNKASFWAIYSRDQKNQLHLESLVELDLKEPLALLGLAKPPSKVRPVSLNPKYRTLSAMTILEGSYPVRVPGYLILVGHRPGYLWVLSEEDGRLKRRIQVVRNVGEEWLEKPDELEWAILGCQPRQNGHLLVATRSTEAVVGAMKYYGYQTPLTVFKDKAASEKAQAMKAIALEKFPHVYWWDVDPETGTIHSEVPPVNVPDKLWDLKMFSQFRFRFMPDGNLKIN